MRTIKVISLLQPWASLVAIGAKRFETRSWKTDYCGELFIHASKKWNRELMGISVTHPFADALKHHGLMMRGAIIGKVELASCIEIHQNLSACGLNQVLERGSWEFPFGDWTPGRYAWELRNPVELKMPMTATGKLGIWDYPWKESDPLPKNPEELYG